MYNSGDLYWSKGGDTLRLDRVAANNGSPSLIYDCHPTQLTAYGNQNQLLRKCSYRLQPILTFAIKFRRTDMSVIVRKLRLPED